MSCLTRISPLVLCTCDCPIGGPSADVDMPLIADFLTLSLRYFESVITPEIYVQCVVVLNQSDSRNISSATTKHFYKQWRSCRQHFGRKSQQIPSTWSTRERLCRWPSELFEPFSSHAQSTFTVLQTLSSGLRLIGPDQLIRKCFWVVLSLKTDATWRVRERMNWCVLLSHLLSHRKSFW